MKAKRTSRHNQLRDSIAVASQQWGVPVEKEPKIQPNCDDRGDIRIDFGNASFILDVSVTDPTAASFVGLQMKDQSGSTKKREREKTLKYAKRCETNGFLFYPICFQTLGGLGRNGREWLDRVKSTAPCLRVWDPKLWGGGSGNSWYVSS